MQAVMTAEISFTKQSLLFLHIVVYYQNQIF